ncbi:hypothetical protein E2C01_048985 [Portunus trituberculatus]|uniref:Uncharacterized protein n=1 Tax=Portunus trituberculatus TaxID=210409 RepID=A0A5B7GET4_PORTR|nr:hypothetical protein [Portunus trituberculatus]
MDAPQAFIPLEVRTGKSGDAFAMRTCLGWTVNGPTRVNGLAVHSSECRSLVAKTETHLEGQIKAIWNQDFVCKEEGASLVEDKRVINLWSRTIDTVKDHYQLPMPFRGEGP